MVKRPLLAVARYGKLHELRQKPSWTQSLIRKFFHASVKLFVEADVARCHVDGHGCYEIQQLPASCQQHGCGQGGKQRILATPKSVTVHSKLSLQEGLSPL